MNEVQKIIKYAAMGFAIFLAVMIITGITTGILALTGVISAVTNGTEVTGSNETTDFEEEFENVRSLQITNGIGELSVVKGTGEKVRVTATDVEKTFKATVVSGDELKISTKTNFWNIFNWGTKIHSKPRITVYLPEGFEGRNVIVDAGAGNIKIEDLNCERLELNAGVGNITGYNIGTKSLDIDGGVGEITLDKIKAGKSDINAGVGNISLSGTLSGTNTLDAGVGDIDLDLTGGTDDFNIKVDPGVGNIYIDGNKYGELSWNNKTAENSLDINGGVGNIRVNFHENGF